MDRVRHRCIQQRWGPISNRGESQLNCKDFSIRRISRTMAPAIAITLAMTAFAQDSPQLRAPRSAFQGPIAERYRAADIATVGAAAVNPNTAQGPGPGPIGPGPGCNLFPAPASVGTTVSLSYFGPPPSSVNQSLVGQVQFLKLGAVDGQICTVA